MLASAETIDAIADALEHHKPPTIVIDPVTTPLPLFIYFFCDQPTNPQAQVMIATTGAALLPTEALDKLHTRLLPLATIITPNVPEALLLLRTAASNTNTAAVDKVRTVDDLETIGRAIRRLGPKWVLVKGGHCPFKGDGTAAEGEEGRERVVDVLVGGEGEEEVVVRMETGYCDSRHTHGTGCSLACEFSCLFASLRVFAPVVVVAVVGRVIVDFVCFVGGGQRRLRRTWPMAWTCLLR
jgi:hydroxymethylpyrimidine/phosphomethylpyrimidine kinase